MCHRITARHGERDRHRGCWPTRSRTTITGTRLSKEGRNGLRKAPPRRSGSRRDNLQRQNLDEPPRKRRQAFRIGEGEIEIDSVTLIGFADITPELARESGFLGVLDLLKVAKHGKGDNIYLIRFHYIPPRAQRTTRASKATKAS